MNRHLFFTVFALLFIFASCNSSGQSKMVVHLDTKAFKEKVYNYDIHKDWHYAGKKPAIIDFYASWCGPCKRMSPVMDELAKEYDGKVVVYKVDIDAEQALAQYFGIESIPTFLLVPVNGTPKILQGMVAKESIINTINEVLLKK